MKSKRADVPHEILARLRLVCLDLPEAFEEEAWAGTRWMVIRKNFAHVLMIDAGWPPAYARATGSGGPLCVLTFRISAAATGALRFERQPFGFTHWKKAAPKNPTGVVEEGSPVLPARAIFQANHSKQDAPHEFMARRISGWPRTSWPRPSTAVNSSDAMPAAAPNAQGNPRAIPAADPVAVIITLLGPGVIAARR